MIFLPALVCCLPTFAQQAKSQQPVPKPAVTATPGQAPTASAAPAAADPPDTHPPAVSGGTPTVTDAAELSAPGWFEFDPGVLKDLDRDNLIGTPFTVKFTTTNNRLQYLLGSDGYVSPDSHTRGIGDTFPGVHYLFLTQDKYGFDVAGKLIIKVPTARANLGGTARYDYSGYALASRDFTKWGFHGDFNAGISALSRVGVPGYDNQTLLSGSTTSPFQGGRWQYTNELVYFSPIVGQDYRITTMHGISYIAHRYAVYSAAVQVALHGDIPHYQLLLAASFNLGHL